MKSTAQNARFWAYVNSGPVKLTLRPDQVLQHREGGLCEEGFDITWTTWEHEGHAVRRMWHREAKDCDGRLDTGGEDHCPLADLSAGDLPYVLDDNDPATWAGVIWPAWGERETSQRDYAAEAMGY